MNKSLGCTGRGHSFGLLNLLQYIFHITTFKIFSHIFCDCCQIQKIQPTFWLFLLFFGLSACQIASFSPREAIQYIKTKVTKEQTRPLLRIEKNPPMTCFITFSYEWPPPVVLELVRLGCLPQTVILTSQDKIFVFVLAGLLFRRHSRSNQFT